MLLGNEFQKVADEVSIMRANSNTFRNNISYYLAYRNSRKLLFFKRHDLFQMHVSQILVLMEGRALHGGLMIIGVFVLVAPRATFVNITVSTCSVTGLHLLEFK